MNNFLIFIAPFIVLIASIIIAFRTAGKDEAVINKDD